MKRLETTAPQVIASLKSEKNEDPINKLHTKGLVFVGTLFAYSVYGMIRYVYRDP